MSSYNEGQPGMVEHRPAWSSTLHSPAGPQGSPVTHLGV